uniref:Holocytochrome c-type synthase n=1 Tax=Lotharella globosa TaxID=91324 RepID=A0A7S4DXX3_9EUKA|mmetsp:Transcript_8362/g.16255  ORF Transcript_8362/g.16255 Transcript_8362/m.16255 type:complete len:207 (-) Transcript_8362:133-753(-)
MIEMSREGGNCTSENNPSNQMPSLSQMPSRGQRMPLPTHRVESTIPKGDFKPSHQLEGKANWTYPSPQQFYNAMKRKGYQPKEEDMQSVVAIHNTVNEKTWKKVMEWEKMHLDKCPNPRLEKFSGRANDQSLKARINTWMGYRPPFDRHDWVVDRCGKKVRYVIDFYTGPSMTGMPLSIHLDVRPAADSFGAIWDRVRVGIFGKPS